MTRALQHGVGFMLAAAAAFIAGSPRVVAQAPAGETSKDIPRLPNGHPDMRGVWRNANISAAFNVEAQEARYARPAGPSVVVDPPDGKIPYHPAAREKALYNDAHRENDPVAHCHLHGVPRAIFPPFPFQIVQDGDYVVMLFETEHGVRIVPTDGRPHRENYSSWAGDSRGRWDGDTLVVDVTGLNGKTWLDQAGNFIGENAHVAERYTMTDPDTIAYEATITEPNTFTRPWTLRLTIRRQPAGVELLEYGCIEGERDAELYPVAPAGDQ